MEFVLVAPLVLAIFAAVTQIGLVGYARATMAAAASDGARVGAMAGASPGSATRRTESALRESLAGGVVTRVVETPGRVGGLPVMTVTIEARIPLIGLLGPEGMTVTGRALREAA